MASEPKRVEGADEAQGMSGWHKAVLGLIVLVLVGSLVARAALGSSEPPPSEGGSLVSPMGGGGSSLVEPGSASAASGEAGSIEKLLPFFTEGSFFALIGFALGYTSRKLFKLALIGIAVLFVGVQVLSYAGVADVEWSGVIDGLNRVLFNLKEKQPLTEMLTHRLPSAGSLVAGYLLGFRRG